MSKSSSFLSLPTLIFLVVMYNVIFDDDDEKKEVEVKTETEQHEVIDVGEVTVKAKEIIIKTKEGIKKTVDEYLSSDEGKDQDFIVVQEPSKEEKDIPKEEEEEPDLKPLDEKKDKPMRSL